MVVHVDPPTTLWRTLYCLCIDESVGLCTHDSRIADARFCVTTGPTMVGAPGGACIWTVSDDADHAEYSVELFVVPDTTDVRVR